LTCAEPSSTIAMSTESDEEDEEDEGGGMKEESEEELEDNKGVTSALAIRCEAFSGSWFFCRRSLFISRRLQYQMRKAGLPIFGFDFSSLTSQPPLVLFLDFNLEFGSFKH
jgi:hypothetical protein